MKGSSESGLTGSWQGSIIAKNLDIAVAGRQMTHSKFNRRYWLDKEKCAVLESDFEALPPSRFFRMADGIDDFARGFQVNPPGGDFVRS
ncbi:MULTISPECIES: hypothetical protein [Acidobacteriaceae]|uniref:hypothetical protein n=1 Tax=Acidobacteriaceae TaxID=204434 RepID=UPI00131CE483|nr:MULTISPECIES: hypothetical protein [Acidobacteriaceae]MDW5266152.1 hypothetical protein [Edaphobacter sp.]